jgi:hypothetical protein
MRDRKKHTQQYKEELFQQKKDKQYKTFLRGAPSNTQKVLPQHFSIELKNQYIQIIHTEKYQSQLQSFTFKSTSQKILGLLLFSTIIASLVPTQHVEGSPIQDLDKIKSKDIDSLAYTNKEIITNDVVARTPYNKISKTKMAHRLFITTKTKNKNIYEDRGFNKKANDKIQNQPIQCPEKIYCSEQHKGESCKSVGDYLPYWNIGFNDQLSKGNYAFYHAHGTYMSPEISTVECFYKYNDSSSAPFDQLDISFRIKDGGNFEAFLESPDSSRWVKSRLNLETSCDADTSSMCPLIEKSSLAISQRLIDKNGLIVGSIPIKYSINNTIVYPKNPNVRFYSINYTEISKLCGIQSTCNIFLAEEGDSSSDKVGLVVIDMTNEMRVVQITQPINFPYYIQKHRLFNLIEFVKPMPTAAEIRLALI